MPHLVDLTMFYAPEGGGVKRYLKAKRQWLRAQPGWTHSLLIPGARGAHHDPGYVAMPSPRIPFANGYRFPVRMAQWRTALKELRPDLIEAGDPYQLAWLAQSAGQVLGVPVVGFYHSDLARLIRLRAGSWPLIAIEAYLARLYRGFDLVFAPSRIMCEKLLALGVRKAVHQPLGVDTRQFHPGRRDPGLRASLGLKPDTRLCVFAGRFSREKNIPMLLRAFARLGARYHLLLIGSGIRYPAQDNVTVLNYRSSAQSLARLLASADLLVHAGANETFGLIVLEAMACGLPAVGVESGALPELIDESCGALARPGDAGSMAEAIHSVYARGAEALGAEAFERVRSRFCWNHTLTQQRLHYLKLLEAGEPQGQEPAFAVG